MTWYERHPVAVVFGAIAGVVLLIFGIWAATVALAPLFGAGNAHIKTNSADYRIAAYDKFHDDCNAIVAQQNNINNLEDTLDSDKAAGVDSTQLTVDSHNVLAAKNTYNSMVGQYNSDASKSATKAQFLSSSLPFHITYNPKETVTCE